MTLIERYRLWRGKKLRSGARCPMSGIYRQCAPNAAYMGVSRTIDATCVRGEPMPPTQREGWHWTLIDATNVNEEEA